MQSRPKADLVIRNIGQLLTAAGHTIEPCVGPSVEDLHIIGNYDNSSCIAAQQGRICFVGKNSDISTSIDTTSAVEIDANRNLVLPGFVDSHTHAIFAGTRESELEDKLSGLSYLEILSKGGGILRTVRDTRSASDSEIMEQTEKRLRRMVSFGTTTLEIKTGYGLDVETEIRLLGIIQQLSRRKKFDIEPTLLSAHALPPEYLGNVQQFIDFVVKRTIDVANERKLAHFCDVFLEKEVFGVQESRDILAYARKKGLLLKLHADEFNDLGGAKLAADLKTVSADHLMRASDDGIKLLGSSGVVCVLLPGTTLSSFAPTYASARKMIDSGCAVAVGTDLSPNSWIESMQFVVSLACYGMRMTPAEAIIASTINGAHAISRARDVGSIEVRKKCDVLITDLKRYEELPYKIGINSVKTVIKNGAVVYN